MWSGWGRQVGSGQYRGARRSAEYDRRGHDVDVDSRVVGREGLVDESLQIVVVAVVPVEVLEQCREFVILVANTLHLAFAESPG